MLRHLILYLFQHFLAGLNPGEEGKQILDPQVIAVVLAEI